MTVLDRWALGEGAGLIAKDFGHTRAWVFKIVTKARKSGDPRAISHADAAAGSPKWRQRFSMKRNGNRIAGWVFNDNSLPRDTHHANVGTQ